MSRDSWEASLRLLPGGARDRDALDPRTGLMACGCGETWFKLAGLGREEDGAVSLQLDGKVAGLAGVLECLSCGVQQLPHGE